VGRKAELPVTGILPWERPIGDPQGTGICLSGGGLRAASFALGALEVLQEKLGLLYGPKAADHLAVVSGGSYIAASHVLTAARPQPQDPPPLTADAPETEHILSHGRYLVEDGFLRTVWRFGWRWLINLITAGMLLLWITVMAADLAVMVERLTPVPTFSGPTRTIAFVAFFGSVGCLGISMITDRLMKQTLYGVLGMTGFALTAPSLVSTVKSVTALSSPGWWLTNWAASVAVLGIFVFATSASALATLGRRVFAPIREFSENVTKNAPRLIGALLICFGLSATEPWLSHAFDETLNEAQTGWVAALFLGTLFGALITYLPDVVAPHRIYRNLLSRCFGVRRASERSVEVVDPAREPISSLAPGSDPRTRFPRLLICATANVRRRVERSTRRTTFIPFIFSHDRSGLPGIPEASFQTAQMELGRTRVGITGAGTEPEVSLMSAVAMTGAAVAPSMGSKTITGLTPFFALMNARLGVWLPNPLSHTRREVVAQRPGRPSRWSSKRQEYGKLGPGFDTLVSEFFGLHTDDQRRIFVTDGGHYDNLGLLALLRARCETIWCVDAYQGKKSLGRQLSNIIKLAETELSVQIDVDLDRFQLVPGSASVAMHSTAVGTITYPGAASPGTLIVIKLALTTDTPESLIKYRVRDRRFPYHSTGRQWFSEERFRHYQRLGQHIASKAVEVSETLTG
jgi:hypothetical protein